MAIETAGSGSPLSSETFPLITISELEIACVCTEKAKRGKLVSKNTKHSHTTAHFLWAVTTEDFINLSVEMINSVLQDWV
jgi:hypothetical protein